MRPILVICLLLLTASCASIHSPLDRLGAVANRVVGKLCLEPVHLRDAYGVILNYRLRPNSVHVVCANDGDPMPLPSDSDTDVAAPRLIQL